MRRFGGVGVLLVIVLALSACSSGKKVGDDRLATSIGARHEHHLGRLLDYDARPRPKSA